MMPETQDRSLQARGMIEAVLPNIEALPPTPISPETEQILMEWGISQESIKRLQELTASFRYDLCSEKMKRLASEGAYVSLDSSGNALITLPFFFDISVRFDGQCGDIGTQWIQYMYASGLLSDMQEEIAASGNTLSLCYCTGQSDTHFNQDGDNHTWNAIALVMPDENVADLISVDAAFQHIFADDRYQLGNLFINVKEFTNNVSKADVVAGTLQQVDGVWDMIDGQPIVLGISDDRHYSFGLSFLFCVDTQSYLPVINRIAQDGSNANFLFDPLTEHLIGNVPIASLSAEEDNEIRRLLKTAQQFTFKPINELPPSAAMPFTIKFSG